MGTQCAQPGEIQTITVHTTGSYHVAWAVLWPDQKPHQEYNGYKIDKVGPDGSYTAGFAIPLTAPLGRARTDVSVAGVTGKQSYTSADYRFWEIARAC